MLHRSYGTPSNAVGEDDITFTFPQSAPEFSKTRSVAIGSGAVAVQGVGDQAYVIKSANELYALSEKLQLLIAAPKATLPELVALGKAILH
jgi:hypothetical protein